MSALYAFCREVDDLADEETVPIEHRRQELARWRAETQMACDGGAPTLPVLREFQPFIREYRLPFARFDELFAGVELDLDPARYPDGAALERYCYHVASVVGLLSIEIFGYHKNRRNSFATVSEVYDLQGRGFPARETVQVSKLPLGVNVEISVIAVAE